MSEVVEIRWHGRAGQGVVTASELLAETALEEGKYFQSFPEFGAERSGAPIRAFSRFSGQPITIHCAIYEPDVVVIFDPTLVGVVDMTEGLKPDGVVVANTRLGPAELRQRLGLGPATRVYTVDATRIAMDTLGRNIPNVPMVGALLRAVTVVSPKNLDEQIKTRLGARFSARVVQANQQAFERAYQETQQG